MSGGAEKVIQFLARLTEGIVNFVIAREGAIIEELLSHEMLWQGEPKGWKVECLKCRETFTSIGAWNSHIRLGFRPAFDALQAERLAAKIEAHDLVCRICKPGGKCSIRAHYDEELAALRTQAKGGM